VRPRSSEDQITDRKLLERVSALEPTSFENLTLDLLRAAGFRNLVWRTPGADGGRDIEGEQLFTDLSGADTVEKWYIECKRYSTSVDWPTLWKKVSFAENQEADYLLLVTNSQPSPQCETEIRRWNDRRKRPAIRVWRGYDIPGRVRINEDIAVGHGLFKGALITSSLAIGLTSVLSKLSQAAYSSHAFGESPEMPLASAATVAELFHQRVNSLSVHGNFNLDQK
jgi:hypothetical protein